jgi:UDP-N-acetylmuramate--alanine ligase
MPAAAMSKAVSLPDSLHRPHFSGLAGTGMSALAEWMLRSGYAISGSDRSFDRHLEAGKRAHFEKLGAILFPQDGSGLSQASCLVVSTAIESTNPEVAAAQARHLPVVHRADLLAAIAALHQTVAVSGTSGKSTVTGMTFHVLEAGGLKPSLISGANLPSIAKRGMLGNAWAGEGQWLVMEADESDGTLVRYHPRIGLILNIEKDHKEIRELIPLFQTFIRQTTGEVIFGNDDPEARTLQRKTDPAFHRKGITWQGRDYVLQGLQLEDWKSRFTLDGIPFVLSLPGLHNVANALAAIAAGLAAGVSLSQAAEGLAAFEGVERRHVRVAEFAGVTVVDDFAHNPAKVKACLSALKGLGNGKRRLLGIFHPHGFAPMKLVGRDIMDEVAQVLGSEDLFFVPDIYYAGGTADTSIQSSDLVAHLNRLKPIGLASGTKSQTLSEVVKAAKSGDIVVSMGARDPGLGTFAANLADKLGEKFAAKAP